MLKVLLVLMALCLAIVPVLAETVEPTALDFGGFTMTIPADIQYDVVDAITDGVPFFALYLPGDTEDSYVSNLVIGWGERPMDVAGMDPASFAQSAMVNLTATMEQQNISVANPTVLAAAIDEIGGKAALSILCSLDVDLTNIGRDLQVSLTIVQGTVAEEGLGTYIFNITADSPENCQSLVDAVNSIVWAE